MPLVLTTATAPEWIVSDILSNFFGSCRTPLLVRQDTNRLNISYSVQVNANVQTLTAECKRVVANLEEEERVVVYVTSIDVVRWVHQDFVKALAMSLVPYIHFNKCIPCTVCVSTSRFKTARAVTGGILLHTIPCCPLPPPPPA